MLRSKKSRKPRRPQSRNVIPKSSNTSIVRIGPNPPLERTTCRLTIDASRLFTLAGPGTQANFATFVSGGTCVCSILPIDLWNLLSVDQNATATGLSSLYDRFAATFDEYRINKVTATVVPTVGTQTAGVFGVGIRRSNDPLPATTTGALLISDVERYPESAVDHVYSQMQATWVPKSTADRLFYDVGQASSVTPPWWVVPGLMSNGESVVTPGNTTLGAFVFSSGTTGGAAGTTVSCYLKVAVDVSFRSIAEPRQ